MAKRENGTPPHLTYQRGLALARECLGKTYRACVGGIQDGHQNRNQLLYASRIEFRYVNSTSPFRTPGEAFTRDSTGNDLATRNLRVEDANLQDSICSVEAQKNEGTK